MPTIEQNLQRLQQARTAIANSIVAKGGTVPTGDGLEEFAADISTIAPYEMTGELPLVFKSDGENLRDYAVYGKNVRTANLFDDKIKTFSGNSIYIGTDSASGISCVLPAGTYTFSVTTKTGVNTNLYITEADKPQVYIDGFPAYGVKDKTFTISQEKSVKIYVYDINASDSDFIQNAMLNAGATVLPYEPYYAGIGERTANLFDGFVNGSINGSSGALTTGDSNRCRMNNKITLSANAYTVSIKNTNFYVRIFIYEHNSLTFTATDWISVDANGVNFTLDTVKDVCMVFRANQNPDIMPNDLQEPMLNAGSTTLPYEPYGYKIPITCGNTTTNLYTPTQLAEGDILTYADTQTAIPTVDGVNTLDTTLDTKFSMDIQYGDFPIYDNINAAINTLKGTETTYKPADMADAIIDAIPDVEVTDSIVSISDAAAYPAEGLEFAIEPVQDLHGYDNPWPAGGNVNLMAPAERKTETLNGVTVVSDGNGSYTISGTANANGTIYFNCAEYIAPNGNDATILFKNTQIAAEMKLVFIYNDQIVDTWTLNADNKARYQFSALSEATINKYGISFKNEDVLNLTISPMIVLGDATINQPNFSPYANICPISGWTVVNGERTGVNVWDEEWESGAINSTTGINEASAGAIRSKNYIPISPLITYYCKAPTSYTGGRACYYDANKEFLGAYPVGYDVLPNNATFTTKANAYYMRFFFDGTTYNHDISVNYPSTDTEYHAYTGTSIPITFPALGKNLFDKATITRDKYMKPDGTELNSTGSGHSAFIAVTPNISYYFTNISGSTSFHSIITYDANKTPIGTANIPGAGTVSGAKTFKSDVAYIIVNFDSTYLNTIQIELGNQATAYEPYNNTVYGGKVDVVNGKLTVNCASVDLGTLDWVYYANVTPPQFRASLNPAPKLVSGDEKYPAYCSEYPIVSHAQLVDKTAAVFYASKNGINICDLRYNNEEDFKAAMSGVQLVYELAEPIDYDITPQQVQMLLGDNNVWCDTGDTTLEYKVDLGRFIAKLQAQATPQLSLNRQAVSLEEPRDAEVRTDEDIEDSESIGTDDIR